MVIGIFVSHKEIISTEMIQFHGSAILNSYQSHSLALLPSSRMDPLQFGEAVLVLEWNLCLQLHTSTFLACCLSLPHLPFLRWSFFT